MSFQSWVHGRYSPNFVVPSDEVILPDWGGASPQTVVMGAELLGKTRGRPGIMATGLAPPQVVPCHQLSEGCAKKNKQCKGDIDQYIAQPPVKHIPAHCKVSGQPAPAPDTENRSKTRRKNPWHHCYLQHTIAPGHWSLPL